MRARTLPVALTFALACLTARGASLPEWASAALARPVPEGFASSDAVVHLVSRDMEVTARGDRQSLVRRLVQVRTDAGQDSAILALHRGAFSNFDRLTIWVQQPGGKTTSYDQYDGTLFAPLDEKVLDDDELLFFSPPGLQPGSVVAAEYKVWESAETPQTLLRPQDDVPVLAWRLTLDARGGWRARARVSQGPLGGPGELVSNGTWSLVNLPATRRQGMGPLAPASPATVFALDFAAPAREPAFSSWSDVSAWEQALFSKADGPSPALDELVRESAAAEGPQQLDTAVRLVRSVRYFSLAIGWGGWRPRPPQTTLERALGDCKDKALVLVAALRRLGFDAAPVLIVAPSDRHVPSSIPSPFHFNHAVAGVVWNGKQVGPGMAVAEAPGIGRVRLIDATLARNAPYDVTSRLEGASALVIDARTTGLATMEFTGPEANQRVVTETWTIGPDGSADMRIRVAARGRERDRFNADDGSPLTGSKLRRVWIDELSSRCLDYEILEVQPIVAAADATWNGEVHARCPRLAGAVGDLRVVDLPLLAEPDVIPLGSPDEQAWIGTSSLLKRTIDVGGIPSEQALLFGTIDESAPFGHVRSRWTTPAPDRVRAEQELLLRAGPLAPEQRDAAVRLRTGLLKANGAQFAFPRAP